MIAWLEGQVIQKTEDRCVINVSGIGYEIEMLMVDAVNLPSPGSVVQLYIAAIYREDTQQLYGFSSVQNRDAFKTLLGANGVGPKMAQSILQYHGAESLSLLVAQGNYQGLTRAKGVGPKLAKRLVIDLKDKLICHAQPDMAMVPSALLDTAIEALMKLGFSELRAKAMLDGVDGQSVETLVKKALQNA
ncbi:Holliday junction branch migration protein RuvA [Gammaproteobacteria bacterium]|nr:Holliday junction branch migration protein RuvA [Gammaproteobacteria bacterium]